jgi:hypothetical protein
MSSSRLDNLRALKLANVDVAFATAFGTLVGGAFLVGYVKHLGGSDLWIGWLAAVPSLLGILQIPGAIWGRGFSSYKAFVLPGGLLWRLFYVPLMFLPLLALGDGLKLWIVGLSVSVASACVLPVNPIYNDWLAEMIPSTSRGWFFSRRNAIAAGVGAAIGTVGALLLDAFKSAGQADTGYAAIFGLGILCAAISFGAFLAMKDLRRAHPIRQPLRQSLVAFAGPLRDGSYRKVLLFLGAFVFAQTFAGNLFSAFAIETLELPFTVIQLSVAAHAVGSIAFGPFWGYLADKYGNRPLLFVLGIGLTLTPAVWLFTTPGQDAANTAILIVGHVYSGAVWGGIAVCQFNLLLATASQEDRANYLGVGMALQAIVGGVAPLLGAQTMALLRGGYDVETAYKIVFGATMGLRFLSVFLLAPVREQGSIRLRETLRHLSRVTPRGYAALRSLSRSANPQSRERAIQEAATTQLSVASDEVVASLHDPSPRVRRQAAAALSRIGDEKAAEALIHMLNDHPDLVEEEMIEALGELIAPPSLRGRRAPLVSDSERLGAVAVLSDLLKSPRSIVRRAAAKALGRIGDRTAVSALLEGASEQGDTDLRRASLQALRMMEAAEIEGVVGDALLDPHPSVRIAAAEAVSEMGLASAADALRSSLERFRDEAASEVAYALGCVGGGEDIPIILREAGESRSVITRRRCLLGVARLLGVEHEAYRLFLIEGMSRDSALMELLAPLTRKSKRIRSVFERYSSGDEAGALEALKSARGERAFALLARYPVEEVFLVAASLLRKLKVT